MGTTISTSVVAEGDQFLRLFGDVLHRVLERAERATHLRVIRYLHSGGSGNDLERYELTEAECLALASQIDDTPWAMKVEVPYFHSNGMGDSVDLVFRGSEFRPDMIQRWGRLQIKCSEVLQLASKTTANFTRDEPHESAMEAFFSRICGLSTSERCDGNVLHGYMYSEAGWLYPATCHAVYHAHSRDFLIDFIRCQLYFRQFLPMGFMTLPNFDPHHVDAEAVFRHENSNNVIDSLPYCRPGKQRATCEAFIHDVIAHAEKLVGATNETAFEYLAQLDQRDEDKFRFRCFTHGGEAVETSPPEELWEFYMRLWMLIQRA